MRDELLGRPLADRDFVVVGATPQELLARGFRPVGRDFPVFLHPETHEEYALARTERKTGRGHTGFSFHAAPGVTLEEDLARRDLTINAMARSEDGRLIDPFGGEADLLAGILRHVGPAFAEDPLRVLRVARFAARFGFAVARQTEALMRSIARSGELATLTPERIWQELARALMTAQPSRFFAVLRRCGALSALFPEVNVLFARPRAGKDAALQAGRLQAIDRAAAVGKTLAVRYAVLAAVLGSAKATALSGRLKVPSACRDLARLAARYAASVRRATRLAPPALLDLLLATDALRRPERLQALVRAANLALPESPGKPAATQARLDAALAVVRAVDARGLARQGSRSELPRRLRTARLRALRDWMRATGTLPAPRRAPAGQRRSARAAPPD